MKIRTLKLPWTEAGSQEGNLSDVGGKAIQLGKEDLKINLDRPEEANIRHKNIRICISELGRLKIPG